ncbi:uncharacterized protein M437DRAFT_65730 [Aureobasidium melanogenum CBS 110374]|uniref:Uncharacterized protein n=1 Tax=Aureobasidium melanogenum (strain CBS 110374) TaxID=1043003 RepID=A0A074VZM8_AURM1|nr:uncharacterized protein M437DRAFT_65730 [Aureobasidium melanogenum CBS 110374]KEQ63127.1 hypothetical protein M437DRAFT_65730 [Aureobasidium melanogenum CBS 110374]
MYATVAANTRALNTGIVYWTEDNTIPAGPHNAPSTSQQQTRPLKKSRLTRLRNFLRLDVDTDDHGRSCRCVRCLQIRGQLSIQVIQEPRPSFSPATPRRAPSPPRRRNSSPQMQSTPFKRPIAKHYQTEISNKVLPHIPSLTSPSPGAPGYIPSQPICSSIRRKPLAPSALVFPSQPIPVPEPSDSVSPISPPAFSACFDSAPISPLSPAISMTASEPDFDQTRINRMSTYSYLDGNTDLSAFATTPYAETFAIRDATPVSFQKVKPVRVWGPVRSATPFNSRGERPKLTLQLRSVIVNRPDIIRGPSIRSMGCVVGSTEYSPFSASTGGASDTSTDNGSLGTHARILKKVLVESLEAQENLAGVFILGSVKELVELYK